MYCTFFTQGPLVLHLKLTTEQVKACRRTALETAVKVLVSLVFREDEWLPWDEALQGKVIARHPGNFLGS